MSLPPPPSLLLLFQPPPRYREICELPDTEEEILEPADTIDASLAYSTTTTPSSLLALPTHTPPDHNNVLPVLKFSLRL